jgi:O-antigen/teichoic acid export membrane protein
VIVRSSRFVLLKNALANVLRGGATAFIALILPPFLVRLLPADAFSVWALVLQLSTYAGFLDFGIQTAVGRFVAHANETGDHHTRNRVVSTSFAMLSVSAVLATVVLLLLVWQLPILFQQLPPHLYRDARFALALVGISTALGLPASVFNGIFIGLQRNEIPAATIAGGRLVGALLLIGAAYLTHSIVIMAAATLIANMATYVVQFVVYRKLTFGIQLRPAFVSSRTAREIAAYCASLSIWSFATLLVTGLDTTLVGIFEFDAVAYYTVAASLITFILGLQNSIFSTLIPAAASLGARKEHTDIGRLLITSTRYCMLILLVTGLPLLVGGRGLLTLWVGASYADQTLPLLQILVVANIIRLSVIPYAMILIGTGQQRLVMVTPIIEGATNLVVSVAAGLIFGALGVALGTLVGSLVGVGCHLVYNMPRTHEIAFQRAEYLRDGVFRPLLSALPCLIVTFIAPGYTQSSNTWFTGVVLAAAVLTVIVTWLWGILEEDRRRIMALIRPLGHFAHK